MFLGAQSEDYFRNGKSRQRQEYSKPNSNENKNQARQRRNSNVGTDRGYHEPHSWYDKCLVRERNKGNVKMCDINGWVQHCRSSITNALELPQSCVKSLIIMMLMGYCKKDVTPVR